jgi:hypothetical protein
MPKQKHIKRPRYSLVRARLNIADEIKIFQNYVRDRAKEGHENTEYPTEWLVAIADALDHVKIPGRPRKTR